MTRDQWLLTGAWAAMAAVGSLSIYKGSKAPEIDPTIATLAAQLEAAQNRSVIVCGPVLTPPFPRCGPMDPTKGFAGYIVPTEECSRFRTIRNGTGVEPSVRDILVLPFPVVFEAKAGLDGTTITWNTVQREVEHPRWMHPKPAAPAGFTLMRELVLGQPEKVAELSPSTRSYTDLSAEPRKTYSYWVTLTGQETDRSNNSGTLVTVTNRSDRTVQANTPLATRVSLVGGDRTHAFLKVETYDRAKKGWVAKSPVLTTPGEKVAGTGWSLKGLRFENFTLVADVTDDDGAVQVLSTRN